MLTEDENLTRAILAAINTQPGMRLAILFGSLAAGRERADSDLDLAVDAGHRLTAGEKLALMNELSERTGRPVDLVDLHAVGEPLLGQILRHGKKCWVAGRATPTSSADTSSIRRIFSHIAQESLLKGGGHGSGSNRAEA